MAAARTRKAAPQGRNPLQIAGVLAFLAVAVAVGFYFTAFKDQQKALAQTQAAHNKLKKDLLDSETKLKDRQKLRGSIECLEQQVNSLSDKLPKNSQELHRFLDTINTRAQESGIKLLRFEQLPPQPGDLYDRVPIELEFYASYESATDFFWKLSELGAGDKEQIVNVSKIALSRSQQDAKKLPEGMIHVFCLAETFLLSASIQQQEAANQQPAANTPRGRR
jgi:Tfp pilus assembly protein PilO